MFDDFFDLVRECKLLFLVLEIFFLKDFKFVVKFFKEKVFDVGGNSLYFLIKLKRLLNIRISLGFFLFFCIYLVF